MSEVAFISVIHDPTGVLGRRFTAQIRQLRALHQQCHVVHSQDTADPTLSLLKSADMNLVCDAGQGVGNARRQALALAVEAGADTIHYSDFDRALHWLISFPAELPLALARFGDKDFTIVGRTEAAMSSHPRCMIQTEYAVNTVFNLRWQRNWDLCAATRGIGPRAARAILEHSVIDQVGTETEWPALLLQTGKFELDYFECNGMEYETPDQFPDEVAAAGGVGEWVRALDAQPEQWLKRLDYARQMGAGALLGD